MTPGRRALALGSGATGAATGVQRATRTVVPMGQLNPRHLDHRRSLTPREYATDPTLFGVAANLTFWVPPRGDAVSMQIAHLQHLDVCAWEADGRRTEPHWM